MKTNNLFKMFEEQQSFQSELYDLEAMSGQQKVELIKEFILASHNELGEILDELPWKHHRGYTDFAIDRSAIKVEIVDVVKFVLNICVVLGITADEFFNAFQEKSLIVRDRLAAEKPKEVSNASQDDEQALPENGNEGTQRP